MKSRTRSYAEEGRYHGGYLRDLADVRALRYNMAQLTGRWFASWKASSGFFWLSSLLWSRWEWWWQEFAGVRLESMKNQVIALAA